MTVIDDQPYIDDVLKGNTNAFSILVDKYKTMVYTLAIKIVKSREEAEEISQDTFIKAFKNLSKFKGDSKFSTWLYKIGYRTALDSLKKNTEKYQTSTIDEITNNLNAELLAEETMTPVCSLAYAERLGLKEPVDLLNATLLPTATKENWTSLFKSVRIELDAEPIGPYLGDGAALLQAVIDGHGVALGRSILIADDLRAGRIIAPFKLQLKSSFSYWFVTPSHKTASSNLIAIRDWLIQSFHENL